VISRPKQTRARSPLAPFDPADLDNTRAVRGLGVFYLVVGASDTSITPLGGEPHPAAILASKLTEIDRRNQPPQVARKGVHCLSSDFSPSVGHITTPGRDRETVKLQASPSREKSEYLQSATASSAQRTNAPSPHLHRPRRTFSKRFDSNERWEGAVNCLTVLGPTHKKKRRRLLFAPETCGE
jgi:hypothetical protein